MITLKELKEKSFKLSIPEETADKDWVLGHLLNGIYKSDFFKTNLIFKGGTCLKKIYFPDFRFSMDLDFSALENIKKDEIEKELEIILGELYQNVGIEFGPIKEKDANFENQLMGYEFYIPFWGAQHGIRKKVPVERWTTFVKIDISLKEAVLLSPILKNIYHSYSDQNVIGANVLAYCIEEIFSEKLRTILQRFCWTKDYYDLWYILKFKNQEIKWNDIPVIFKKKCKAKNIKFNNFNKSFNEISIYKLQESWEPSIKKQLPIKELPDVNLVIEELKIKLMEIFDEKLF